MDENFPCGHPRSEANTYLRQGHRGQCRGCIYEHNRSWEKLNPERSAANKRDWTLRKKYGITEIAYQELVKKQCGLCALCGIPDHNLVVDHDHSTGRVRMLLCSGCNIKVGVIENNPTLIPVIQEYIAFFKEPDGKKA